MNLAMISGGGVGALGAGAALFSLLVMWPFIALAAGRLSHLGDPTERMGLRRSIGYFVSANLGSFVSASLLGLWLGETWAWVVPVADDPLLWFEHELTALTLDLLPFLLMAVATQTLVVWGLNLRRPRPEQLRQTSLALYVAAECLLTYLLAGALLWGFQPADRGDFAQIVSESHVRQSLASAPERIWYVDADGPVVLSVRADGSDGRVEWAGPAPDDFESFWIVCSEDRPARLVFVQAEGVLQIAMGDGRRDYRPLSKPAGGGGASLPASARELALLLGVPAGDVLPRDACRPRDLPSELPRWSYRETPEAQAARQADRDAWLRQWAQGMRVPTIPSRRAWTREQEFQLIDGERLILTNFGRRLFVLDSQADRGGQSGWFGPLGLRVRDYVVVPPAASAASVSASAPQTQSAGP
ncbi:MAG: hypothetical protein BIFFINMI_04132 [Phycisphaerae bacterium]|nr:hypothetical protein [Phycisphaerae bacterium]